MTDKPKAAFPCVHDKHLQEGMTLRQWYAGQALPQLMAEPSYLDWGKQNADWPKQVAIESFAIADAMIAAEQVSS